MKVGNSVMGLMGTSIQIVSPFAYLEPARFNGRASHAMEGE